MTKYLLAWALVGETTPLLFLLSYRYIASTSAAPIFEQMRLVFWPFSMMLMMTGGGDEVADDQTRAASILLNGFAYSAVGLIIWFFFFRRRLAS